MRRSGLERRGRMLAEALGGAWTDGKGIACCPAHDDRTPSLGLRTGERAILLHCFAGCSNKAVLAALARRGIAAQSLFDRDSDPFEPTRPDGDRRGAALRLWRAAAPLEATLAAHYLAARALVTTPSSQLRFLANTPCGPRGHTRWLAALIAAVTTDSGLVAIQRHFLTPPSHRHPMARPKRGLGRYGVGAVRLHPPVAGRLGLAEGVENALSAFQMHDIACWATLGNARFGTVAIPESVTELHLFLDADRGGDLAEARSVAAYARSGRTIIARRPPAPFNDWNDALRARCPA